MKCGVRQFYPAEIEAKNISIVSDKWAWTMACVPLFSAIFDLVLKSMVWSGSTTYTAISFIFAVALNCIFFFLDKNELESKHLDPGSWIWTGLLFIPVYLFVRASKINQHWGYAITWCVTFILTLVI
jgi:hypothetical protein